MRARKAETKQSAQRYRAAGRQAKGVILDEHVALTGWNRNEVRAALREALEPPLPR